MTPTTRSTSPAPRAFSAKLKISFAFAILLVMGAPLASAVGMGPLGDVRVGHWSVWVFVVGLVALVLAFASKWLTIKPAMPILFALGATIILVAGNGFFAAGAPQAASIVPGTATAAAAATAYDPAQHDPTSDLTFSFANAYNSSAVNPTVSLYKSGATTSKAAVEGSSFPIKPAATATGGALTSTGWQSQIWGCDLDAHVSAADYYEALVHVPQGAGMPSACSPKDTLNTDNDVSLPPISMKAIGTFDIDDGGATLTCAAGSDCIYPLTLKNSEAASYLTKVAVQVGTLTNATINSVDSSSAATCSLELNDGVQYIVLTVNGGEIGPLQAYVCNVHIARAAGSDDGSAVFTANDLYREYDSPAFVTNTNILSADASSALTVDFA